MNKRTINIATLLLVLVIAIFLLSSCTVKEEKLIGTWESESTVYLSKYGCSCSETLTFSTSGEYLKVLYKASTGDVIKYETGTWTIEKRTVSLSIPGELGRKVYDYKNKKLKNGDWTFVKR